MTFVVWATESRGKNIDDNDAKDEDADGDVVLVALLVILLLVGSSLLDQDGGGDDLQDNGDGEQGDHEGSVWTTELQRFSQLVSIGGDKRDIHES